MEAFGRQPGAAFPGGTAVDLVVGNWLFLISFVLTMLQRKDNQGARIRFGICPFIQKASSTYHAADSLLGALERISVVE